MATKSDPGYVVIYEGVVSGSMAGRDDGFPETKVVVCSSLAEAGGYHNAKDARVFSLSPVKMADAIKAMHRAATEINAARARQTEAQERETLAKLLEKYPDAAGAKTKR